MDSEKILIERTLKGDHLAFKKLVLLHERLIFHILSGLLKHERDNIEDLFQEVLIKIYHRLPSFQHRSKLSTWIGKITHNHCLNHLRRERRKPETNSLDEIDDDFIYDEVSTFIEAETKVSLYKAIEKLPDQYQLTLTLFHLDNLNYEEITEVLKIPEGTVKSRLFRARKILKEILMKMEDHGKEK